MSISCMEVIVKQNVENQWQRISEEISSEYKAMTHRHAAIGKVRCGDTVRETIKIIKNSSEKLRDYLIEQYKYAFSEAVIVQESLIEDLDNIAEVAYQAAEIEFKQHIQNSLILSGAQLSLERIWQEEEPKIMQSRVEVSLALNQLAISKGNSYLRNIAKTIVGLLSKLCAK